MFNSKVIFFLVLISLIGLPKFLFSQSSSSISNTFTFKLESRATTSAGVYKGGALIRTLWSNEEYDAGTFTKIWDGKNNAGIPVDPTGLHIEVLTNNIEYAWDGIVGNNFANADDTPQRFRRSEFVIDMAAFGDFIYTCGAFSEGYNSEYKIKASTREGLEVHPNASGTGQSANAVCTDGINVYWGGDDPYAVRPEGTLKTFVHGIRISDGTELMFTNGISPYPAGHRSVPYASAFDQTILPSTVRAMAVQKTGDYIFIFRTKDDDTNNTIHVCNKNTGVLVQDLSFPSRILKMECDGNYIWIVTKGTPTQLNRYLVNSNGTLTLDNFPLSGLVNPLAITFSPDGTKIAVADGGTSQQVKFYNKSTGAYINSIGQVGGYANTTLVADDRFMFRHAKYLRDEAALGYTSDGTIWVLDPGNYRLQHFNTSNQYINYVMMIGYNYSVHVDNNDSSRLFVNYNEFKIDYTKPLANDNGSWKLHRNWLKDVTYNIGDAYEKKISDINTLSNGRTYAYFFGIGTEKKLVELSEMGIRTTGQIDQWGNTAFDPDGSIRTNLLVNKPNTNEMDYYEVHRKSLVGFDGSNNPVFGPNELIGRTPNGTLTTRDPYNSEAPQSRQITSTGLIGTYMGGKSIGYHAGAIPIGATDWKWKALPSTFAGYLGDFPDKGYHDIGNGVEYAGRWFRAIDRCFFYGYNGEFWKGYVGDYGSGQTNKTNIYYDNGLMVGQYGVIKGEKHMSGSTFGAAMTKAGNNAYQYNNDESFYGGVHRWSIKNINTINVVTVPFTLGSEPQAGVDLLAGLPPVSSLSTLVDSTAGWTRIPASDNSTIKTIIGARTYNKFKSADLHFFANTNGNTVSVTRDLGNNTNLSSWALKGVWNIAIMQGNYGENGTFIDVLDNADKIIARFRLEGLMERSPTFNDKFLSSSFTPNDLSWMLNNPITLSANNGVLNFSYGPYSVSTSSLYDGTANIQSPKKFRISATGSGLERKVTIVEMRFISNSNTTSTTPNPPTLSGDDIANTLAASHTFGDTAIVVSENGSLFTAYSNKINVGNVARPAGYWKFKVKAATLRHESAIVNSPEFTITNTTIITTPVAPTVVGNAATMALIASHPLGDSVILVSENGGTYMAYTGKINVGNVTRPPGYWKFKVKSGFQRSESVVISSPEFTFTTLPVATTPAAPIVVGDNGAKILIASHSLGDSVILVCENGGPYLPYAGQINVGDVAKPAGYWKFKTKVGVGRNESLVSESPAFNITIQNITPAPPTITIDDINNMLTASHVLGASEIVVSANGSGFVQYPGTITVGNVDREAGYYKFKIKAAPGRNESILAASPAFTINTLNITPATPIIVADDAGNTLTASHALGDAEILVSENGGVFAAYSGLINVGNVNREAGYYKFRIKAAAGRNESAIANSPAFTVTIPNTTPDAPTLIPDDAANTLIAVHALGNTEILVSENGGAFGAYSGQINVGNVSRPAAYWKFKIKTATGRNESLIANSPAFTVTIPNTTPDAPILIPDDAANTLIAVHALGNAEILVSENGGAFGAYSGQINVGNVSRPAAYWRFKIKAALQRNESAVINSPEFTATATPDAPIITGDDVANTLTATHSLGSTQIVVSENGAAYLAYTGLINVGNVSRPAGYWKFKIKAVLQRNESVVVNSPVFTVTVTPDAPVIVGDDGANTLIASHTLGTREILVSENGGTFATYTGIINVGNVSRPSGYWKFKIKAALQRNESAVINSPEFTATTAPPAPEVIGNDIANTLVATHALGNPEIVVSENGGAFVTYLGPINVGNVSRPAGYWKFKIKGSIQRNESAVVNSPIFTITVTPVAPDLSADDAANTLTAFHSLGTTEILVSVNGGPFAVFTGMINVGNVSRPAGYWRFKIKAALQRDESSVVSSPLFTINAIIVAPNVNALTLPVQLTSLKATQVDKEVLVQWNATSELNLDRYEVERSTDGRQFRVIGTVPAKGNAVSSDYEFFDKTPFSEDNYYRIKSIDKSGEIRFSNVVYVKFITNNGTLNVYPNPIISNNIFIQSNNLAKGEYVVSLLTSTGQTIFTKVIGHVGGMFTYSVPLSSSLAKGVYMFHFSGKELRFNKQLLK